MGAAKENRDRRAIADRLDDEQHKPELVSRDYLSSLRSTITRLEISRDAWQSRAESAENDLDHARALIARQRAEITCMREERDRMIATVRDTKRHIAIASNLTRKYAVGLVLKRLQDARLI